MSMTKEAFEEWKSNPTTIEIYKILGDLKKSLQDNLANGQTLCSTADATMGSTARMIGNIEGLNQLLNISFEDEEKEDGIGTE